jgi:selenocysteine-specific elongation factor
LILGTAGHIDHGKTELIKALTGIDTDRLQEEKSRGISIDLGFAHLGLSDGTVLGIVDVPGHERFIKNMLAGVGGIDLVLFVVACDEGIMPQTREHFDIVSLLGVHHAVFALTKADLVDDEMMTIVRQEVEGLIQSTPFEGSSIVATSAKTGQGLDRIVSSLEDVATRIEERRMGGAVRLPTDRVFTMTGRGTVVTGTLWSGHVAKEDRLEIRPGGKPVRVRSIEVHGKHVDKAFAGQRTALGLHGVQKREVQRGDCIISPGDFKSTSVIDSEILLLPSSKSLKHRARIRFHLAASETMARVFLVGTQVMKPGEKGFAQVRFEEPIVAGFGDRFVIRSYSPMTTIGGGRVLDPLASRHKRKDSDLPEWLGTLAAEDLRLAAEAHIRRSSTGLSFEALRPRLNCGPDLIRAAVTELTEAGKIFHVSPGVLIHAEVLAEIGDSIVKTLEEYQSEKRLKWGMPKEELRERLGSVEMSFFNWILSRLEADGRVFMRKGSVRAGSGDVQLGPEEERARSFVVESLKADMFQPPSERDLEGKASIPAETVRKVIALLIEDGLVIRLEPGLIVHKDSIQEATIRVTGYLKEHGEATASDLKTAIGTTRKYAVPLLEHLDRLGVTRRRGATRTLHK